MSTIDNQVNLDETFTISPLTSGDVDYQSITTSTINTIDLSGLNSTFAVGAIGGSNTWIGSNTAWTTGTTTSATGLNWGMPAAASQTSIGQSGKMSLRGKDADVDINGKSLKDWMEKVEERLNILTPNPELEKEWDDLRRLGERYRKLEKKCKEKAEVWKKLKQMPPPNLG